MHTHIYIYTHIYIHIHIYSPPRVNKPPPLIKSQAPGQLINRDFEIQGYVNKHKTRNTTWSHLGVIFGVILEVILGVILGLRPGLRGSKM